MRRSGIAILTGLLLGLGCGFAAIPNNVTLRDFFGLTFNRPVFFAEMPGKDSTYVVAEQLSGLVIAVRRVNGAWTKSTLVTVTVAQGQNEQGLLGFAFHPQFRTNRKYYLSYNPNNTSGVISEREVDTSFILNNASVAAKTVLTLTKGNSQNGGSISFGSDGYLYIATGDGGGSGDPQGYAQNRNDLRGKILRIDVNGTGAGNYSIPADNPYAGQTGVRGEVWAQGLRNPWRFSLHPVTQQLWAGDVGVGNPNSTSYEELDLVPKGGNMGWPILEGKHCYPPPNTGTCITPTGYNRPALEIDRTTGNVVIGGVFFYGNPSGGFHDTYIYGSYGTGRISAARVAGDSITEFAQIATQANVSSFGVDARGRVFAVKLGNSNGNNIAANTGAIMVLESPDMIPAAVTGIRPAFRNNAHPLSRAELFNSGKYSLRSLDGRVVRQGMKGVFMVFEKNTRVFHSLQLVD